MRKKSTRKVGIRGTVIGGEKPLICLPLLAGAKRELLADGAKLKNLEPDLIEWRIDCFKGAEEVGSSLQVLRELREVIGAIPLLFTCRSELEGGQSGMSDLQRLKLVSGAIVSGDVDIVDVEISSGAQFIDSVEEVRARTRCRLILSYHNFEKTPSEQFIVDKLALAEKMGADIAKVAVMPHNNEDVLTLLSGTNRARTKLIKIPMITISMGEIGAISRLAAGIFGSDITFAMGTDSSAPGQLPFADVRRVLDILG